MMFTSLTKSIPQIPIGESGRRFVVNVRITGGQPLSPAFTNPDIIVGLVYEHTTVELIVVQMLDDPTTAVTPKFYGLPKT